MKFLVPLILLGALCTCFAKEKIECGTIGERIERIVAGDSVTAKGIWPWQISIKKKRSDRDHLCGGSIIKPNWIVTAANCFEPNSNPDDYIVIAGKLDIKKVDCDVQEMDIQKIIKYPKYIGISDDYNLALLKLKNEITFNDKVRPICLPTKRFPDGEHCYATGWGNLEDTKKENDETEISPILQQLEVPLLSDKECRKHESAMTSRMICGCHKKASKGVWNGDIGGPLACKNKSSIWELAGVAIFVRLGCTRNDGYDFFTNMVELKGWVEDQVKKNDIDVATKGAWPWQISIKSRYSNKEHFCGGSIIKSNWVVTAANCFEPTSNPDDFIVIAGDHNLEIKEDEEQEMDIEKIILHPKYTVYSFDYNIALLKLTNKIAFNNNVRSISLPTKSFPEGKRCYATGWSIDNVDKKENEITTIRPILEQRKVTLLSDTECQRHDAPLKNRNRTLSVVKCGYHKIVREGTKPIDFGGPLACKNKYGIWALAGVMMYNFFGNTTPTYQYDYFTNVAEVRGWIEDEVKNNRCTCPK